jgi:O-antigen/teichoic acid export membrane protein
VTADRATARGALVGIATVVAERGVAFMVILALAHLMTPAEFGQYGYLLAGISLVQVIADQGLEVAAVARMAASPAESGSVVGAVLRWRLLLWAVVVLPVGGLVLTQVGAERCRSRPASRRAWSPSSGRRSRPAACAVHAARCWRWRASRWRMRSSAAPR